MALIRPSGQNRPTLAVLWGTALVAVGLSRFVQGLKPGLCPLGEAMAWDFARTGSLMRHFLCVTVLMIEGMLPYL
ncbi:DUF1538 family protein [uncultured Thiodictyon sp.]|uniref:DUF1538 family protein n=1 Tax=uncultured Thiodictyon sp. TaxID=1846217 RepID=UPI0025D58879|nr:DUF1538 family protein [uncultured Thiodictyon sp.]